MKSGMLAAEAMFSAMKTQNVTQHGLRLYPDLFQHSWLKEEIFEGRNFAAGLAKKIPAKLIHLGAQYVTGGQGLKDPLMLRNDHETMKPASSDVTPDVIDPAAFDGTLYVDKLTGVFLSKTAHREDQPSHILVHDTQLCIKQCYPKYKSPCTRFCPGNVYEIDADSETGKMRLKLNPSNCLHCKTCDIKDPFLNITWTCPEGGEGPGYSMV
jgi:electron-transferring-flavoprotein dehydrogenase